MHSTQFFVLSGFVCSTCLASPLRLPNNLRRNAEPAKYSVVNVDGGSAPSSTPDVVYQTITQTVSDADEPTATVVSTIMQTVADPAVSSSSKSYYDSGMWQTNYEVKNWGTSSLPTPAASLPDSSSPGPSSPVSSTSSSSATPSATPTPALDDEHWRQASTFTTIVEIPTSTSSLPPLPVLETPVPQWKNTTQIPHKREEESRRTVEIVSFEGIEES